MRQPDRGGRAGYLPQTAGAAGDRRGEIGVDREAVARELDRRGEHVAPRQLAELLVQRVQPRDRGRRRDRAVAVGRRASWGSACWSPGRCTCRASPPRVQDISPEVERGALAGVGADHGEAAPPARFPADGCTTASANATATHGVDGVARHPREDLLADLRRLRGLGRDDVRRAGGDEVAVDVEAGLGGAVWDDVAPRAGRLAGAPGAGTGSAPRCRCRAWAPVSKVGPGWADLDFELEKDLHPMALVSPAGGRWSEAARNATSATVRCAVITYSAAARTRYGGAYFESCSSPPPAPGRGRTFGSRRVRRAPPPWSAADRSRLVLRRRVAARAAAQRRRPLPVPSGLRRPLPDRVRRAGDRRPAAAGRRGPSAS